MRLPCQRNHHNQLKKLAIVLVVLKKVIGNQTVVLEYKKLQLGLIFVKMFGTSQKNGKIFEKQFG